ncbi:hypothetical protein M218_27390 [Burkholderia pseudomallei MSHR338]|nr:hypothetical protein M218_27390 [Burkholderia pseudomallei MSHR338]
MDGGSNAAKNQVARGSAVRFAFAGNRLAGNRP